MAADQTLIQGAYKAALADTTGDYGKNMAAANVAPELIGHITNFATSIKQNRQNEWNNALKDSKNRGDSSSKGQQNAIYEYAGEFKDQFLNGTQKDKEDALINLRKLRLQVDDIKEWEKGVQQIDGSELDGNAYKHLLESDRGGELLEIMKGGEKPILNPNRKEGDELKLGHMVTNPETGDKEWMSSTDLQGLINGYTFDVNSENMLEALRLKHGGKGVDIDEATLMNDVDGLVKNGKFNSLLRDEYIPNHNFLDDLREKLHGMTYEELGIEKETLDNIDAQLDEVDQSDGINEYEAFLISEELIKDQDLTKQYISQYFTTHLIGTNNINNKRQVFRGGGNNKETKGKYDDLTFPEAFKAARAELGKGKTFMWKANQYTTNYESEVAPGTYGPPIR